MFSNIEQQSLEFVKYTLEPWIVRWEQSINRALLSETEKPTKSRPV
ncbi:phage portal protein [Roseburia faecis]|uniref:Phage portal protein n=1 Tax=Roseburia faecis TaxID=301302 RepID=A0A844KLT0_9FIRM|nr:phage portal protein [Roseburia faecis]MTR90238.1 phage portal protein [Roseburia faecis]HBA06839.1 phage portal protein [Roseburia sp.]